MVLASPRYMMCETLVLKCFEMRVPPLCPCRWLAAPATAASASAGTAGTATAAAATT